jgi:hypothetical protein
MIDGGENLRFVHGAVTRGIFWYWFYVLLYSELEGH